jgi:adenine-specific DNA-methyltransferase
MSKEDVGRNERFLHIEIDSKDIDTLEEPKVLTGFRYVDQEGQKPLTTENGVEFFDNDGNLKQNLLINGNNLLALHTLKTKLSGKVQLIYIDPPYNTGSDSFLYNDSFNHSSWLTFMKNRIEVAKDLLTDDGTLYVHLDHNEAHYGKVLLDEIFGKNNFVREIIWFKGNTFGYAASANNFVLSHDTILMYSKTENFKFNKLYEPYSEEYIKKRFTQDDNDGLGKYRLQGKNQKQYLNDSKGIPIPDVWQIPVVNVMASEKWFATQKPEAILERIISASTDEGDIVLDFCLGSGTTASVAHKMNRRWIGIEQMDYIETIANERLKKVVSGEQGGISRNVNWKGGGSFVYFELKKYNQEYADHIEKATSLSELEDLYVDMRNNAFLKFWFDRNEFEKDENFRKLDIEQRKQKLIDVLDENQLYLNYADMNDTRHEVSDDEKALTDKFYGPAEN